jgi:hypothetical protein
MRAKPRNFVFLVLLTLSAVVLPAADGKRQNAMANMPDPFFVGIDRVGIGCLAETNQEQLQIESALCRAAEAAARQRLAASGKRVFILEVADERMGETSVLSVLFHVRPVPARTLGVGADAGTFYALALTLFRAPGPWPPSQLYAAAPEIIRASSVREFANGNGLKTAVNRMLEQAIFRGLAPVGTFPPDGVVR